MTQRIADRIYQTSITTGTGPYQFGPVMPGGYRAFSEIPGIADGDTVDCYVDQQDSREFEVGTFTYRAGGTLERTTLVATSNGGAAVDWQAGTRRIGLSLSARQISDLPAIAAAAGAEGAAASGAAAGAIAGAAAVGPFLSAGPVNMNGQVFWRRASGAVPIPVAKPLGEGSPGIIEVIHNDTVGYLQHLLMGANSGAAASLIALGVDSGLGNGLLVANKAGGKGIIIDQKASVSLATAYGMIATQSSTLAPLVRLENAVSGGADTLQLIANGNYATESNLLYVGNSGGEVGTIRNNTGVLDWARDIVVRNYSGSVASRLIVRDQNGTTAPRRDQTFHTYQGLEMYKNAGADNIWYPRRISSGTSGGAALQGAANTATPGVGITWVDCVGWGNGTLGFFGKSAIGRQTAAADATDLATCVALANSLKAILGATTGFGLIN